MEPLLLGLLKKAADKVLDRCVDRLTDRNAESQAQIANRISRLESSVDLIREDQERTRAGKLEAGLKFLRMGDFGSALERFVDAASSDRYSAVAKVYLAALLYQKGQEQMATEELASALLLNSYVLDLAFSPDAIKPLTAMTMDQESQNFIPWSLALTDRLTGLDAILPKESVLGLFSMEAVAARSQTAVVGASFSDRHLIVQWILGRNLRKLSDDIITVFDATSGQHLRSILSRDRHLCFASPSYFVLRSRDAGNSEYQLVDINTGNEVHRMSASYYAAMFCPEQHALTELQRFRGSNIKMVDPAVAYQESSIPVVPGTKSTAGLTDAHSCKPFLDESTIHEPFFGDSLTVRLRNLWEHWHFSGSGNLMPRCYLCGDSRISLSTQTQ